MQVTLSHFSTVPCRLLAMKIFVIGSGTKTHSIGMRHKHLTTCTGLKFDSVYHESFPRERVGSGDETEEEFQVTKVGLRTMSFKSRRWAYVP